jgi:hypothetical protein
MRQLRAATLGLLLAGWSMAGQEAARFWEAQPYGEWTLEQTLQVLTNSPWTRPARLVETGAQQLGGGAQHYFQWYSAQTVREALVRLRNLYGQVSPEADAKFLTTPPAAYQVFVFAALYTSKGELRFLPLTAFDGLTAEEMQQGARLIFSSQEHSARPDRVEFVTDPKTRQTVGLRLLFERAREAVPPTAARRGQVRLVCPTRTGSVSVAFVLDEMQRRGQPDL